MMVAVEPAAPSDALEEGSVVFYPKTPFALPSEADLDLFRVELPATLKAKNVSYYPGAERLTGLKGNDALRGRVREVLKARSETVVAFLRGAMPAFAQGLRVGTSSFRPLQERGRALKAHASNELVHVDAGAYGATHGDRILRVFTNVHPTEPRVWCTRGTFRELFARYGEAAGVRAGGLDEGPLDRARSAVVRGAARLGVKMATVVDSSPYDRAMRRFHNFMKDSPSFRDGRDGYEEFSFPPFSTWLVLTDARSHACLSGQHAFVDTFVVPLANCARREHAPYWVLAGEPATPRRRAG